MSKYNINQISKTLEKLFQVDFKTEKSILNIKLEDLQKIRDLTTIDMNIIIDFKKAIKDRKTVAFLSGELEDDI